MKSLYDFTKGKWGPVLPPESEAEGKTRIAIRLDKDIVDRGAIQGRGWLSNANQRGAAGIPGGKVAKVEDGLRRIILEELKSSAA